MRDHLGDVHRVRVEIQRRAVNTQRRQPEEVVARAAPAQRQVVQVDAPVADPHDGARALLLEVVFRAELHASRADVEGDQLLVIGREARELDVVDGDAPAGRQRLEPQRSAVLDGAPGHRAQAGLDGRGHAGLVRQAVHRNVDVAYVGDERRLHAVVAKVDRRLLQGEATEGEPRPGIRFLGVLSGFLRPGLFLGLGFVLRRLAGAGRQVRQVQRPVVLAAHVEIQARHGDLVDVKALRGQIAVADLHREPFQRAQRPGPRLVLLLDVQLLQRDVALDRQLGRAVARAHEPDVQSQRQPRRFDGERQVHRHERQVAREVQLLQPQLEHGLQRILERLGAPLDRERRAVDRHAQAGLDERIQVHRQRRDERNTDAQARDLVVIAGRTVVEDQRGVVDVDVVQREARRRRIRRRGRRFGRLGHGRQMRDDVREVVGGADVGPRIGGRARAHHVQAQRFERDLLDHRRAPEHRRDLRVDVQAREAEERRASVGFVDPEVLDGQRQRERIEPDAADADFAPEQLAELLLRDVARDRRHGHESQQRD